MAIYFAIRWEPRSAEMNAVVANSLFLISLGVARPLLFLSTGSLSNGALVPWGFACFFK